MITLKRMKEFHGHLGPYLILGLLMGECGLRKVRAKKYFGIAVKVRGVNNKPQSCLVDGLQLSTGATYGKGNIKKLNGNTLSALFLNLLDNKKIKISLKKDLVRRLNLLKGYKDSEEFARIIYKSKPEELFEFRA